MSACARPPAASGAPPSASSGAATDAEDAAHSSGGPTSNTDRGATGNVGEDGDGTPATERADSPEAVVELDTSQNYPRGHYWPEDFVFPKELDTTHVQPREGEYGDIRVEHHVATRDIRGVARVWRKALKEAGYLETQPCREANNLITCIVERRDAVGVRRGRFEARIYPQADDFVAVSMQLYPVAHVALDAPPGACVIPPTTAFGFRMEVEARDEDAEPFRYVTGLEIGPIEPIDLDGDGELDRFVPRKNAGKCPRDLIYDVYLMRGECGHLIGSLSGELRDDSHISKLSHGVRTLYTEERWGTYKRGSKLGGEEHDRVFQPRLSHHRVRQYRFDGTKLRMSSDKDKVEPCRMCSVASCADAPLVAPPQP